MFSISPFSTTPINALLQSLLNLRAEIVSSSEVDISSKIVSEISSIISNDFNIEVDSLLKNFNSTILSGISDSEQDGKILILSNSQFDSSATISSEYITRTLGLSDINIDSGFNVDSFIRVIDSVSLDANSNVDALIGAIYYNQADFNVYAVITSNLSQVNRDIVYYILTINREDSYVFNILRVK